MTNQFDKENGRLPGEMQAAARTLFPRSWSRRRLKRSVDRAKVPFAIVRTSLQHDPHGRLARLAQLHEYLIGWQNLAIDTTPCAQHLVVAKEQIFGRTCARFWHCAPFALLPTVQSPSSFQAEASECMEPSELFLNRIRGACGYRYHARDGTSGIWCGRRDEDARAHAARDKRFDVACFF